MGNSCGGDCYRVGRVRTRRKRAHTSPSAWHRTAFPSFFNLRACMSLHVAISAIDGMGPCTVRGTAQGLCMCFISLGEVGGFRPVHAGGSR